MKRGSHAGGALKQAIGILGGTFAPIHNGHLRLAIEAREQLDLREVRLIPAAQPPHRAAPAVSAERRLHWVRLAVEGEPGLVADAREVRRGGPSYTVETLEEIRAGDPHTPLCLVLGRDSAAHLPEWRRWEALLEFAHLVVFGRAGASQGLPAALRRALDGREAPDARALHARPCGLWRACEMPPMDVSATLVRARLAARQSVRGLVPDAVIRDLRKEDLEAFRCR